MKNQKELIPMLPGDLLKFAREQAGLTLEQASRLSRIKPSVLTAIEAGDTREIPSVYLRGYIRNYARALQVDLADIEEQMPHVQGSEPEVRSVFTVDSARGRTDKWLKASSYFAASAIIAALAWQFTHEAVRFSQGDSQLTGVKAELAEPATPGTHEAAQQSRPANTHLNASIASVEVLQQRRERGSQGAGEQAWQAIGGQGAAVEAASGQHHLTVTTSADSWVEILDGTGTQLELDLIRAGSQREYSGSGPFQVMLGRASAVQLSLDGEAIDLAPYTTGDVARLTLGEAVVAASDQDADSANR
jgi:cytoskeleton protein RodZ